MSSPHPVTKRTGNLIPKAIFLVTTDQRREKQSHIRVTRTLSLLERY